MTVIQRVAIVGVGTMGRAIARRMLEADVVAPDQIRGSVKHDWEVDTVAAELGITVGTDNVEAAHAADLILICTKPKGVAVVMKELAAGGALDDDPLVVSIAAGVSTSSIEAAAGDRTVRVVRCMPNTPCLIGEGMIAICRGNHASRDDLATAEKVLAPLGRVARVDEENMDAVTGLSGSGPAFVYVIIEALSEGGVMIGLPRKTAVEMAAQTVRGAAGMVLRTGRHPASLKDDVTTPAGCTISALLSLEDGRLRSVLARGVQEAARAASGLG
jgi:pyrroline-5-carboxylate reductase